MARGRGILFVCTGNSARSQMAEGFARRLAPPGWKVYSAGVMPAGVHPLTVAAMAEVGIDIEDHWSKGLAAIPTEEVHVVVTLCDHAAAQCPPFPEGVERHHWPLPDPVAPGRPEEALEAFRRVRDEIRRRVEELFGGGG